MRFYHRRDFQTIIGINKELINTVIDDVVALFKINVSETKTNIYGEGSNKTYYTGVLVPCLINRQQVAPTLDGNLISVSQPASFAFLRQELEAREIYPEPGDLIQYHNNYFEILTANETQLPYGQTTYNMAILCETMLTRAPAVKLERPIR